MSLGSDAFVAAEEIRKLVEKARLEFQNNLPGLIEALKRIEIRCHEIELSSKSGWYP